MYMYAKQAIVVQINYIHLYLANMFHQLELVLDYLSIFKSNIFNQINKQVHVQYMPEVRYPFALSKCAVLPP